MTIKSKFESVVWLIESQIDDEKLDIAEKNIDTIVKGFRLIENNKWYVREKIVYLVEKLDKKRLETRNN